MLYLPARAADGGHGMTAESRALAVVVAMAGGWRCVVRRRVWRLMVAAVIVAGPAAGMVPRAAASTSAAQLSPPVDEVTAYAGIDDPVLTAPGPGGTVWFTNRGNDSVGKVGPDGTVSVYVGAGIAGPEGIAQGPDQAMWFTNADNNTIGRISMDGTVTSYGGSALGGVIARPWRIAAGPDGALWFTNMGNATIGRITTDGTVTAYPAGALSPYGIAAGPDGALWYTTRGGYDIPGAVGRITTLGVVTTYANPLSWDPTEITSGPDCALWFVDYGVSIDRIGVDGVITSYAYQADGSWDVLRSTPGMGAPTSVTQGPGGLLWFTEENNAMGTIAPGATATPLPGGGCAPTLAPLDPPIKSYALGLPFPQEPSGISADGSGHLWFVNAMTNTVAQWSPPSSGTTTGTVTQYRTAGIDHPSGIAAGADGAVWVANAGDNSYEVQNQSLGRITTSGSISALTGPAVTSPFALASSPQGAMWFTNRASASIGRIGRDGAQTALQGMPTGPTIITAGSDGAMWFTASSGYIGSVNRVNRDGTATTFTDRHIRQPEGLVAGPDHALWFTDTSGSIGRITTEGAVTTFDVGGVPRRIAVGPDKALWYTDWENDSIGRITTDGQVTHFTSPDIHAPLGIAAGADGAMWFTNEFGDSIGRITMSGHVSTVKAPVIRQPQEIAAGPDGAMWFTNDDSVVGRVTTGVSQLRP